MVEMNHKFREYIIRNEKILPLLIFILFLAASIPGVNWGVPALWNPDELVWRVDKALGGEIEFDETEPDFNYPSLPKYVMFGIGKIVYGMGYSQSVFIISVRLFSALLGALSGVLIYYLARLLNADHWISALAGLLYIASGLAAENSRFAHNDLYLQFFTILCVYFGVKYHLSKNRLWIYASFVAVGMAASSKYTGASLIFVPLFIMLIMNGNSFRHDLLRSLETLFIGGVLAFCGYSIGTPKALLWMAYYVKRVVPAARRFSLFGFNSGAPKGIFGQWGVFEDAVGVFIYCLFMISLLWFVCRLVLYWRGKLQIENKQAQAILILVITVLLFDLPFLISINYVPRFFMPFVPFLSILGAMFIKDVFDLAKGRGGKLVPLFLGVLIFIGISYSLLRLVSVALLFMNDARQPATEYIASLPVKGKIIEYTLYPPDVDKKQFSKAYNYPIYFVKYPDDVVPSGGRYEYNQGEQGLLDRNTDYLVIDTFTYERFYNDSICNTNLVECNFFKQLLAGNILTFRLVKEFTYTLPLNLPKVSLLLVNPGIRIYERVH